MSVSPGIGAPAGAISITGTKQIKDRQKVRKWDQAGSHLVIAPGSDIEKQFQVSKKNESPNFWVSHGARSLKAAGLGPRQQERYEKFCLGFLYFYDTYINTGEPHSIYFEWEEQRIKLQKRAVKVSIYISPAPKRFRPTDIRYIPPTATAETDPPQPPPPPPPEMGREM